MLTADGHHLGSSQGATKNDETFPLSAIFEKKPDDLSKGGALSALPVDGSVTSPLMVNPFQL